MRIRIPYSVLLAVAALVCASCATQPGGPATLDTLDTAEGAVGYVTGPADEFIAVLTRDGSTVKIEGKAGEPVELGAGVYQLSSCAVRRAHTDGALWSVSGAMHRAYPVTVRAGETTALEFGPPLKVTLSTSSGGGAVTFKVAIQGRAGEVYAPDAIQRGRAAAKAPAVSITNAAGKQVNLGRFRYG